MASKSYSKLAADGRSDTELLTTIYDRNEPWYGQSSKSSDPDRFSKTSIRSVDSGLATRTVSIRKWPVIPKSLSRPRYEEAFKILLDLVLCCIPLMFLILAGLANHLSGKTLSDWGNKVVNWTLLVLEPLHGVLRYPSDMYTGANNISNFLCRHRRPLY